MKRAITLGGGGPAVGLHLGALKCFREHDMEFDVWALACIGAWVGCAYNSFEKETALEQTEAFFRKKFRDDATYDKFPIPPSFAMDLQRAMGATLKFMADPSSYHNLVVPHAIERATKLWWDYMSTPKRWNPGNFNHLMLEMAAANPVARYFTSMAWRSDFNGLSRIFYEGSANASEINFDNLYKKDRPYLYHNAWNLNKDRLQLFANRTDEAPHYLPMTMQSLCACSALPYIIEPIEIDGVTYCEGALVRTVNFTDLLEDHPDLEEVWVVRIVGDKQIRAPKNLDESLNNLCMLFAGSLGECNVKEFEDKVANDPALKKRIKIHKVHVSHDIDYSWNYSNLEQGIEQGYEMTRKAVRKYQRKNAGKAVETA